MKVANFLEFTKSYIGSAVYMALIALEFSQTQWRVKKSKKINPFNS